MTFDDQVMIVAMRAYADWEPEVPSDMALHDQENECT
jgi:hypothetical protein